MLAEVLKKPNGRCKKRYEKIFIKDVKENREKDVKYDKYFDKSTSIVMSEDNIKEMSNMDNSNKA